MIIRRIPGGAVIRRAVGSQAQRAVGFARDAGFLTRRGNGYAVTVSRRGLGGGALSRLRAMRALRAGRPDTAMRHAETILARDPDDPVALHVRRRVLQRRGEISAELKTIQQSRAVADRPRLAADERRLEGLLRETEPGWLPRVPGPGRPLTPRADNVVMHLLKHSLPQVQAGYTIRSRYSLLAQRDAGLDPFVVTSLGFPRSAGLSSFPRVEIVDGIAHHRLDLGAGWPLDGPVDLCLLATVPLAVEVAEAERPAIIQAASGFRGYDAALVGLALREHLRIPLVYEVRGFHEGAWAKGAVASETAELFLRRAATERRTMLGADAVITLADVMRDDLVERGIPAERIAVVPNGVDVEQFQPTAPDPELRARLGLEGRAVFGYITSLENEREDLETLISATALLVRRGRTVACLIVGDGKRRPKLERLARECGVADVVVFTGRVPHRDVRNYYGLLDIFVVPRRDDRAARFTTPIKPFEAMSMGLPLVVADLPALEEVTGHGTRGLPYPTADAAGLASTLELLLDDPEMRARLGAEARRWVLAERTWASNGRRYRELYEAVLDRHRARSATARGG